MSATSKRTPVRKKPAANRGRRTEIQTPDSNAETPIRFRKSEQPVRSTVGAGEVKAALDETVWRVINEISPGYQSIPHARLNSDEIAYVLMLAMMTGHEGESPRRGLKIGNHEYAMRDVPECRSCR